MSTTVTVQIKGLLELQKALLGLPLEIRGKPLNSAVLAGAKVIRAQAISNAAPLRKTGVLEANIVTMRSRTGTGLGRAEYAVGVKKTKRKRNASKAKKTKDEKLAKKLELENDAYYWRFLEFGTSKMAKRPFLRPAFESAKTGAADKIKSQLAIAIDKAAAKLRNKK